MVTRFKCPDCDDITMSLAEDAQIHSCPNCDVEMTVEAADKAFEAGDLIVCGESPLDESTGFNGFANTQTWAANLILQTDYKLFKEASKVVDVADAEAGLKVFVESNKAFKDVDLKDVDYSELVSELAEAHEEVEAITQDLSEALCTTEDLTDEQKETIASIFESALHVASNRMRVRIEEETAIRFDEEFAQAVDELNEQADRYLTSVAQDWFNENRIAIESGIKVEKTEQFLEGLHQLFADNFIEVPEERFDVLADLAQKVDDLTEAVATAKAETLAVKADLVTESKKDIVAEMAKGLVESDVERLSDLAESVDYESDEQFTAALKKLKESLIDSKNSKLKSRTNMLEESFDDNDDDSTKREPANDAIARASRILSRK